MSASLRRLIAHLTWADIRTRESLATAMPAPPAEALRLYSHILGAEAVWLARLTGIASGVAVWPTLTLSECERLGADGHRRLAALVDGLGTDDLDREVCYVNSAGQSFASTTEDILLHVALHGAYHRGQVAQILRGHEHLPAPTDYIAYIRGVPAATRRPEGPPAGSA